MKEYVLAALIILSAGIIPQITGFGVAALSMSLLPFVLPMTIVIPLVAIMSTTATGIVAFQSRSRSIIHQILPLVFGSACGVTLGMYMLPLVPDKLLRDILGITLVFYALYGFIGRDTAILSHIHGSIMGAVAGFFSAFFNIQGPLVGLYVSEQRDEKMSKVKGVISTYMFVTGIFTIVGHVLAGRMTSVVLQYTGILLPFLAMGLWVGAKVGAKIRMRQLRLGILALVLIAGLSMLSS